LPWKERKALDEKKSFIEEWERQEENLAELCRRYEISRQTGYKWLERYQREGEAGLQEHSRTALHHPLAMVPEVREALVSLRSRIRVGVHESCAPTCSAILPRLSGPRRVVSEICCGGKAWPIHGGGGNGRRRTRSR
jgi:transposase-like protein